jgi:hypothetical protein
MPDILTSSEYSNYLSQEAQGASQLDQRVQKAEIYVITRYRAEQETPLTFSFDATEGDVLLEDWEEDASGDPDVPAMPDDLVDRLRIVIADVVEYRLQEEEREGVQSVSQGDKSRSYEKTVDLPSRLFFPLEKYDQREGITGWW